VAAVAYGAALMRPPWIVTLVCGASGVGKTSVAAPLAARYGAPLAEADDVVTAMKAVTTPEQHPILHVWATNADASVTWPSERIAAQHLAFIEHVRPAFVAIIGNHLEYHAPVVLEGDYFLPDLVDDFGGAVRAVVIDEPDEARLEANFDAREPRGEHHDKRAEVSMLVSAELARSARAVGMPVVTARPWGDVTDRVDAALRALS
jgi:2-phosphoglycerate kinase